MAHSPFFEALTEGMSWHYMLPFKPVSTFPFLFGFITVGVKNLFFGIKITAAIKGCVVVVVDLSKKNLFGFIE